MSQTERVEFKKQKIVTQHRINDISEEYEMLRKTDITNENEVTIVHNWGVYLQGENVPFVITRAVGRTYPESKKSYYHFYVNGPEKKRVLSESKKITGICI